jgi:hypothetical protein
MPKKSSSLDAGISALALKKLSKVTAQDFLTEFKNQGITSLEDLAKQTAAVAQRAGRSGIAIDWEDMPMCYKFTMVRPHFDPGELDKVLTQMGKTLFR